MGKALVSPFPAVLLALAPGVAWSQPCWGFPHMMWGGGWLVMVLGQALTLAVFVALIVAVVVAARRAGSRERTPIDILKERFASGEIDKAEFEDRRRTLGD